MRRDAKRKIRLWVCESQENRNQNSWLTSFVLYANKIVLSVENSWKLFAQMKHGTDTFFLHFFSLIYKIPCTSFRSWILSAHSAVVLPSKFHILCQLTSSFVYSFQQLTREFIYPIAGMRARGCHFFFLQTKRRISQINLLLNHFINVFKAKKITTTTTLPSFFATATRWRAHTMPSRIKLLSF